MTTVSSSSGTGHPGPFQLIILVLSVVALLACAVDAFVAVDSEISRILQGIDLVACAVFFADFVHRFNKAEKKLLFMKWGWIDLLACVPNVDALRVGRFIGVLRILRLLRGVRSLQRLVELFFVRSTRGGVSSVAAIMFLIVSCSSVAILACEQGEGVNIKTAEDAVWWSVTTITTVGYGDRYPVTAAGRLLAMGLMVAGVGLFGALSGIVASALLGAPKQEEQTVLEEVRALRVEIAALREQRGRSESRETGTDAALRAGGERG